MPMCMIAEWNEYLNFEIKQWTEAILGAVPAAKAISPDAMIIKDPAAKTAIFDKLGKM